MRIAPWLIVATALSACTSAHQGPELSPTGPLTEAERERARAVPSFGEVVATLDDQAAREYVGTAALQVSVGSIQGTLLVLTTVATTPTEGLGGHIRIPDATAETLSTTGWDFTLLASELGTEDNIVGDELSGVIESVRMRADPSGLFVMTVTIDEAGARRTVNVAGRLTGGCTSIDAEGGLTTIADPTTVPECEAVMGAF